MILQDMTDGQPVTLELIWGTQKHRIKTSVIGKNTNGVLIKPFIYNGVVINLPANKLKDITFNLFTIDPETNTRKSWKHVNVVPVTYKGSTYYACSVSEFQKNAIDSERREHPRMELNADGLLEGAYLGENHPIKIYDISDNGISFLIDKNIKLETINFKILLSDKVHDTPFDMTIHCRSVRSMERGEQMFYGCSITQADKKLLMYVFLKKMEQQAENKTEVNRR